MPRVSKKRIASRQAGERGRAEQKRRRLEIISNPETNIEDCDDAESDGWQSDAPSEGMLTEEEDSWPFGQPEAGWKEAERALHGYSKTRVYQQKLSYHKHKDEIKRRRDEKKALSAGIPITQQARPVWGDIRMAFKSVSSSSAPIQSFDSSEQQPLAN